MAQGAVGSPIFGQFHHGAAQVAVILLKFLFKAGEKRERVRRGTGETSNNFVIKKAANLSGLGLDDALAHRHLTITADRQPSLAAHA